MIYQRFIPEGWNNDMNKYSMQDLKGALDKNITLQGRIEKIDKEYNAYINLGNNIKGIIPNKELGNIMQSNPYVQFKVSSIDDNTCYLSRKAVKDESLNWAINDLSKGFFEPELCPHPNGKLWELLVPKLKEMYPDL